MTSHKNQEYLARYIITSASKNHHCYVIFDSQQYLLNFSMILSHHRWYLASFCANLSPVKLTDKPSNFLTTTDSNVLESLSLYLVSKRLRKTLSLSHLLLQFTLGMSVDDGKCVGAPVVV